MLWAVCNYLSNYIFVKVGLQALLESAHRTLRHLHGSPSSITTRAARPIRVPGRLRFAVHPDHLQQGLHQHLRLGHYPRRHLCHHAATRLAAHVAVARHRALHGRGDLFLRQTNPAPIHLHPGTRKRHAHPGPGRFELDPDGAAFGREEFEVRSSMGARRKSASQPAAHLTNVKSALVISTPDGDRQRPRSITSAPCTSSPAPSPWARSRLHHLPGHALFAARSAHLHGVGHGRRNRRGPALLRSARSRGRRARLPDAIAITETAGGDRFEKVSFGYTTSTRPGGRRSPISPEPDRRAGRWHRRGQEHAAQSGAAFLRSERGRVSLDGRDLREITQEMLCAPDRDRPPGHTPFFHHHARKHRLRPARRDRRGNSRGGATRPSR